MFSTVTGLGEEACTDGVKNWVSKEMGIEIGTVEGPRGGIEGRRTGDMLLSEEGTKAKEGAEPREAPGIIWVLTA